ncbi:MAG TPA: lysoplasmalogenase [Spirochaetota bacterium]|nr:lysoplasmalogenase [Spirochaetota bacterium]
MMNTLTVLALFIICIFLLREFVAYKRILFLKYLLTPLITAAILIFPVLSLAYNGFFLYAFLIFLSLLFALIADVLLMLEEYNYLKSGMIFFMLGHIFYVLAFSISASFMWWNLILLGFIAVVNYFYLKLMKNHAGKMFIPVLIYVLIIDTMGYFAITGLNNGFGLYEISVAAGAVLFWISDFILSINAFVRPINKSTVWTWLFYAPAQMLFAISTVIKIQG